MSKACYAGRHECIKKDELEKWGELSKKEREILGAKAADCVFCRRLWTKFWAEKK